MAPDDPVYWAVLRIEEGDHLYVDGEEMRTPEEVVVFEARVKRWTEEVARGIEHRSPRDVATFRTLGRRPVVRMPVGHPYWTLPQVFVTHNTSSSECVESNPLSRLHGHIESLKEIADRWRAKPPVPPKPAIAATGGARIEPPTPAQAEEKPAGEQGQPSRREQGQQRYRDVEAEVLLKNNINTVIAKAKAEWPDLEKRPGVNQMARLLVAGEPNKKVGGYRKEAIRKILSGTYKPAKDRGIFGLGSG